MFIGDKVCLSPNIKYRKIDLLPLNDDKAEIKIDKGKTTLEVLEHIEKSQGEFELF